jgi:membrane-bound metal-dependent hydrolase YbcI (DUF457 family)
MDNLTHTLFAVTLARTPLGRGGRGTLAALVVASNAPDLDIIAAARGKVSYLAWHRGPTHGPLGIVGLGLITAGLVWLGRREFDRLRRPASPGASASLLTLAAVSIVAVLLHVLMDLPTAYGTRIFSPFDWHWFAYDWLPIIDIYLLTTLVVGLVFAEMWKASRRRVAAIVLMLIGVDYGVRAAAHHEAMTLAPALFGSRLPPPCDAQAKTPRIAYWPRTAATTSSSERPCLVEIAAVPTLTSPFRWTVIARLSNAYELHDIDILDTRWLHPAEARNAFWSRAVRYPDQWQPATFAAAATRTAGVFLGFSRFPAARSFVDPVGVATVRWSDMRFTTGMFFANRLRPANLFTVLVRLGPDGSIKQEELGP